MTKRQQVGVTKALRWVLLWILLGIKMQMVEAAEEKVPVPPADNEIRWRRMKSCDRSVEQREEVHEKVQRKI